VTRLPVRLGIQQRILPAYRVPFFDMLAGECEGGLSLFAGDPLPGEGVITGEPSISRIYHANNRRLPFNLGGALWQTNILDWVMEWDPDILICEANPRTRTTPAAIRAVKSGGGSVIGWGLGAPEFHGILAPFLESYRRRVLFAYDAIIAYSQTGADQYARLGIPPERIFTACNAVAAKPAHSAPERKPTATAAEMKLLFVGRLQDRKRVDLLLEACARQPEGMQPVLWIVGDGPALDTLREKAKSVYPRAVFFGALQGRELEEKFSTADLFILPGTGGLAVQQAMSFALPVIVAEADGTQEDLVRPENGWRITPGHLDELTKTITLALRDISILRAMGLESYRIVSREINLERMVEGFKKAILFALSSASRKGG
jgi:glycosyltransferase involved in cell wall biosynthesis